MSRELRAASREWSGRESWVGGWVVVGVSGVSGVMR